MTGQQQSRLSQWLLPALLGAVIAAGLLWIIHNQQTNHTESGSLSHPHANSTVVPALSFRAAVEAALPAIVSIQTQNKVASPDHPLLSDPQLSRLIEESATLLPPTRDRRNLGSGIILSADGYIVTNHHVVMTDSLIEVQLHDGRRAEATLVGSDEATDLALLRVPLTDLPALDLMHQADLRVGDVVLALGNPFGVGPSVTQGIVSAKGRTHLGLATFEDFIQTDAAINPGNSGGALINIHGQVVGINTAVFSAASQAEGIGFAIPAALADKVVRGLKLYGKVRRGYLGVNMQRLSREQSQFFNLPVETALIILKVAENSPGQEAGLQPGDIITHINNSAPESIQQAHYLIAHTEPGNELQLNLWRQGVPSKLAVQLREREPLRSP